MISISRLQERIEILGKIGQTPDGGVTRLALSNEDKQAQALVSDWMKQAGMRVYLDPAGNLIGRIEGENKTAPPVVIGSHIDSVVNGGKFDGTIGVIGGIEVVQHLKEEAVQTLHPIEVVAFCEEEGSRFQSGLFGSRAMIGAFSEHDLHIKDKQGVTRREALIEFGLDPDTIKEQVTRNKGDLAAYLEMHIEQGPILENMGAPIGIVTGIAGPSWMEIVVEGKAGHAGTLPMGLRQDALLGAGEIILSVEEICLLYKDTSVVGTVGHVEVLPGGSNTVPGCVTFSVDIRDIEVTRRDDVIDQVKARAKEICEKRGLRVSFTERIRINPVPCSPSMLDVMRAQSREMNLSCPELVSGAGHDAQLIAALTDMGMIFVRCKDGVSHNPEEFAEAADIVLGTELLSRVVLHYAIQHS
jgi:allantoate deiminase